MSERIANLLDGLDFFRDFSFRELEALSRYCGFQEYEKGEVIFNEGDAGTFMLVLVSGKMSVYKAGESGRHLLSYEGKGRIVGEMALLDRERRSATCFAEEACEVVTIGMESVDQMGEEAPALAYRFMHSLARLLSRRLRRTSGLLAEHLVG